MDTEKFLYTKEHEWVFVENNVATVGITDYAQQQLGEVVFVELPEVDADVEKHGEIGAIESSKAASDIYSPVAGKIIEVNQELEGTPELLNEDAFAAGWICKIQIENTPNDLMTNKEYQDYLLGL